MCADVYGRFVKRISNSHFTLEVLLGCTLSAVVYRTPSHLVRQQLQHVIHRLLRRIHNLALHVTVVMVIVVIVMIIPNQIELILILIGCVWFALDARLINFTN